MSAAHRRSTINRRTFLAAAALSAPAAVLSSGRSARAQTAELRIATAWPEASGAGRALTAWGTLLARRTNNMVRLRFLFASAMGTDQDVVRRLRLRQVEGAMLTPVGARSFNTPLAVLEAPGVCPTYATLDTVRQAMMASFETSLAGAEMKLLGMSDLGAKRIFARRPIVTPDDMRGTLMWSTPQDALPWQAVLSAASVSGRPETVAGVLPALRSGVLDAYPATSIEAAGFGWNTRSTHVTGLTHGLGCGITVVHPAVFNGLSGEHQRLLLETAAQAHAQLRSVVRRDDEAALAASLRLGAARVDNAPAQEAWNTVFRTARTAMVGFAYTAEVLAEAERLAAVPT